MAAVSIRAQSPAWVAGALDSCLVLLTHLTTPQVTAAVVHRLACPVVGVQMEARGAGALHPLPGDHCTLVAAAPLPQHTLIWEWRERKGLLRRSKM